MSTLGRFFEFYVSPTPEHRVGGFKTGASAIAQGAPVRRPTATVERSDLDGLIAVELVPAATGPKLGESGIVVWEQPYPNILLDQPDIKRASDYTDAPKRTAIQLVHGTEVEVIFRNLSSDDLAFEGLAEYDGRNMVKPADLAAMEVGQLLTPGDGNDDDGYYKVTNTLSEAWFRVTDFDADAGFCIASMLF